MGIDIYLTLLYTLQVNSQHPAFNPTWLILGIYLYNFSKYLNINKEVLCSVILKQEIKTACVFMNVSRKEEK